MSSADRCRRVITLADCRGSKVRGDATPVLYVARKAPRRFRRGGRQNLFVQIGPLTLQIASCGTHSSAVSAKAAGNPAAQVRMGKPCHQSQEGPACPGKPPAR